MPLNQQLTIATRWKGNGEGTISFRLDDIPALAAAISEIEAAAIPQSYGATAMINITQSEVSVTGFLK